MTSTTTTTTPRNEMPFAADFAAAQPVELQLEGVGKAFGDHVVLREVNLTVRQGEMIAVVGASGCGKTVMLKLMIGHLHPDGGRVLAADHESPKAPLVDLAMLSEKELDRW